VYLDAKILHVDVDAIVITYSGHVECALCVEERGTFVTDLATNLCDAYRAHVVRLGGVHVNGFSNKQELIDAVSQFGW
jgi:hypothetical protein